MKLSDPYLDVNNRSVDVKNRKAFGLRSNYVQITFDYVRLAQILRKNYVKKQGFFGWFETSLVFIKIYIVSDQIF